MLTSASGGVNLTYDPSLRLYQVVGAATTRFAYDGRDAIAEYNGSNVLQRRFVHGPGVDEPIVQYEGTGTTDRRFLSSDERGSIISLTDSSGTMLNINRYDEYGKPQSTNAGRFQYTGQKWIGEANLYDYKARDYLPHLGIFAQTDPIGYEDSPNLYAYVLGDPVNLVDPLGLATQDTGPTSQVVCTAVDICVTGQRSSAAGSAPGVLDRSLSNQGDRRDRGGDDRQSKRVPCNPTMAQLKKSGKVYFAGKGISLYGLLGYTVTQGTFHTQTGISGNFVSIAFGVGVGVGASFDVSLGGFNNLGSFVGGNDNLSIHTPIGSLTTSKDLEGRLVGGSGGYGFGPNVPNLLRAVANPLMAVAATSVSANFSSTDIYNVTCPAR